MAEAFDIDLDKLVQGLDLFNQRIQSAISNIVQYNAIDMTGYMRDNAPWNDDTGAARNGLHTRSFQQQEGATYGGPLGSGGANKWTIIAAHSVPYGFYLETKWSGKYAIIEPTIQHFGPIVLEGLRSVFDRIRGGE